MDSESGRFILPNDMALSWSAATDIGLKRKENQDSYLSEPPFFLVADGMGGNAGGKQASSTLLEKLATLKDQSVNLSQVRKYLAAACEDVMGLSEANLDFTLSPPGTTLTGIIVLGSLDETGSEPLKLMVLNIGDSRTYETHNGVLTQVTHDHSQVAEMIDRGMITPQQAQMMPNRSVITRAIGAGQTELPVIDTWEFPLQAGRRFLICSDGLSSMINDGIIGYNLVSRDTPEQAVRSLVATALEAGGKDNVTVIVLDVEDAGGNDA